MKRWLVLIPLIALLIALALTARAWLPPLLAFIGANTDLIQGLEAAAQIILGLAAGAISIFGFVLGRRAALPRQEIQTGGAAAVLHDVNVTDGDFIGGNKNVNLIITQSAERFLTGLHTPPPSRATLQKATEAYYQALLNRHQYLDLHVGIADRVPIKLPLLDLYVPLKARTELPEGETWHRGLLLAGRQLPDGEGVEFAGRLSAAQPVLDLAQKSAGLIILGDPGAGKTTFLKFLALKLALGEGAALGLGERLPVLVPLSEYANVLGASDRLVRLDDFIVQYLHDCGADLPFADMLHAALDAGQALILLDGLDEVNNLGLRTTVTRQVAEFYAHHRNGNKFVLTSRVVGYREARLTADGIVECTLEDFSDDEISDFVARWTVALEREALGEGSTARADAARERRDLLDAIHRNPGVRRLAANPLLLSILALMKRQGVTLPERRVKLYDQYVDTLISIWNRKRGLGRSLTPDLDSFQTTLVLAPLALWMHEVNPGLGLVKREDLCRRLEAIYQERGESKAAEVAERFLEDVHRYTGLLLERGAGQYGFIHLTFEEYLAAVGVSQRGQRDYRLIVDCLAEHIGDPAWREVALLTVGHVGIIQGRDQVAGDVVEALAAEQPGPAGEARVLAGEAVLDAWPGGVPPRSKERVTEALVATMQDGRVPPALRRRAGLCLGRLGWPLADLDAFVEVPAGKFVYGDPGKRIEIPYRFWIGKYPVTNAQFDRFVADRGYERQEFWSADGWAWRNGAEADLSFIENKEIQEIYRNWLAGRPREKRRQPFWWDDPDWNNPLFPVVGVSWFEAEAYCAWLDRRLERLLLANGETIAKPSGYVVRLPAEAEWERAARGTAGQEYPWAGEFDFANANVAEETGKGIGTTAVCTYPQGVSPTGAWDMSGNVWEWTHSLWSAVEPYRVVRGGSWSFGSRRLARCAVRSGDAPGPFTSSAVFGWWCPYRLLGSEFLVSAYFCHAGVLGEGVWGRGSAPSPEVKRR